MLLNLSLWELPMLLWINTHLQSAALDTLAMGLALLGDSGMIFIVLTLGLLLYKPTRHIGLCCALALMLDGFFINILLKPIVARVRPYDLTLLRIIVEPLHDFSFPSGHTGAAFAFAFALRPFSKKWHIAAVVFGALMGLSRIYLCVHFPTDVLCGAVIGALCGIGGCRLKPWLSQRISALKHRHKPSA